MEHRLRSGKNGFDIESLHLEFQFWRYDVDIMMDNEEKVIEYMLGPRKTYSLTVPAKQESARILYTSCNNHGELYFTETTEFQENWTSVIRKHKEVNYHLLLGGGNQVIADGVLELQCIQDWLREEDDIKDSAEYSDEVDKAVLKYYTELYLTYFSRPFYRDVLACVPSVNINGEHEYFGGFGSLPPVIQNCYMIQGIFRRAQQFYLLFQLQTAISEARKRGYFGAIMVDEPPAPYLRPTKRQSFSYFRDLGYIAILVSDCRGERSRDCILSRSSWDIIFRKLGQISPQCKHLLVMCCTPLVFPNVESSCKHLQNTLLKLCGKSETDLSIYEGWGSSTHGKERDYFVDQLLRFVQARDVRVTFLSSSSTNLASAGFLKMFTYPEVPDCYDPTFMMQLTTAGFGGQACKKVFVSLESIVEVDQKQFNISEKGQETEGKMLKWKLQESSDAARQTFFLNQSSWMSLRLVKGKILKSKHYKFEKIKVKYGDILAELFTEAKGNSLAKPIPGSSYFLIVPLLLRAGAAQDAVQHREQQNQEEKHATSAAGCCIIC